MFIYDQLFPSCSYVLSGQNHHIIFWPIIFQQMKSNIISNVSNLFEIVKIKKPETNIPLNTGWVLNKSRIKFSIYVGENKRTLTLFRHSHLLLILDAVTGSNVLRQSNNFQAHVASVSQHYLTTVLHYFPHHRLSFP